MMNSKSVNHEELFVSWIAKKTKPAYMYEIRDAIREVDAYCLSKKIITQSLLETVDIVAVRKARNVVEGNKFFRLTHRKKFPKYVEAIRFFESYIKEYIEDSKDNNEVTEESSAVTIEEKTEPDTTGSIETNASASVTPEKAYESPAEMQVEKTHINETEYDVVSVISGDEFSDFDENDKTDASEEISLDESDIVESSTQEVETDNSTELPIEEKVRRVLKKECQKNQFGTTALFVSSRIIGAKLHEVERVLKEVPWAKLRYGRWTYDESEDTTVYLPENIDIQEVDFNNLESLAFTKPISFSYFEDEQNNIRSWKELYVRLFTTIYEDYPHMFSIGQSFTSSENRRVDFGDYFSRSNMRAPKEVVVDGTTVYLETNLSASDIVGRIKYILDLCSVDYENVVIKYYLSSKKPAVKNPSKDSSHSPAQESAESKKQEESLVTVISQDEELQEKHPHVYGNLLSLCKIYKTFTRDRMLNSFSDNSARESAAEVLDQVSWIKKVDENTYVFVGKTSKAQSSGEQKSEKRKIEHVERKKKQNEISEFYEWMVSCGYSLYTVRSYSSAITWSQRFALEHNFEHCELLGESTQRCILAAKELLSNAEYLVYNEQQHDRFGAAIVKYLEFKGVKITYSELKGAKKTAANKAEEPPKEASIRRIESIDTSPYEKVMEEVFVRGFRLESKLDLKKFKRHFEALNGCEIDKNDEQIIEVLKSCCIEYDDKLFLPKTMLSSEVREKLFMYINKCFCDGKTVIYYDALFAEFSESFLDYYIYNAHMLMLYLDYYYDNKFHVGSKYISKEALTSVDLSSEIKEHLIAHGVPMDTEQLCAVFSNVPESEIRKALREDGFIFNGGEQYFYISMIVLTQADIEGIAEIIQHHINEQEYITSNELLKIIKVRYPHIVENNTVYSDLGIRNAIGYHIHDKFAFNSVIISGKGKALYAADVFVNFVKSKDFFDLNELQALSIEIDRSICFEDVYDNCLRISETQFVSKKHQQFRIEETDIAIERFCTGNYTAIDEISEFGSFPDAGYQWNNFLLSNYIYGYSKKFRLITARLTKTGTAGAIVKRNCGIETMDDLLIDVLSKSQCPLQKKSALEYLVNKGYLSSRAYKNIGNVLIKAQAMRNRKG